MPINTDSVSERYREQLIDKTGRKLLVTKFPGSTQTKDLTVPPNCDGFGRIRHFRRASGDGWPNNPLPIDPACRALKIANTEVLRAQVFQIAACNWRCWYCFVPYNLLSASPKHSAWLDPSELVDLYLSETEPPPLLDLSGGQPDLVPEWIVWTLQELKRRKLEHRIYVWSDDSLSIDYFWTRLTDQERDEINEYPLYGRVCCFKGFDPASFSFNTNAEANLFERQFELMGRLLSTNIDLYAYVTFTAPSASGINDSMARFVDRLQTLDPLLPLRTIPLKIQAFTPVRPRLTPLRQASLDIQNAAIEAWQRELSVRFSTTLRELPIVDVRLKRGRL